MVEMGLAMTMTSVMVVVVIMPIPMIGRVGMNVLVIQPLARARVI